MQSCSSRGVRVQWDVVAYAGLEALIGEGGRDGEYRSRKDCEGDVGVGGSDGIEHSVCALATVKTLLRSRLCRACLKRAAFSSKPLPNLKSYRSSPFLWCGLYLDSGVLDPDIMRRGLVGAVLIW